MRRLLKIHDLIINSFSLRIYLFLWLCLGIQTLKAQDFAIEKAMLTHKSSFTSYSNYPVTCFKEMYIDGSGKVWLTECGIGMFTVSGIYNFDGYEFRHFKFTLTKVIKRGCVMFSKTRYSEPRFQLFPDLVEAPFINTVNLSDFNVNVKLELDDNIN